MKKGAWKKRITKACVDAGTYRDFFDYTIDALAETLERRDEVAKRYKESGDGPVIEYTNKAGATNLVKNPALTMWDDLNKSALAYWRDLGLTPSGLKRIDESAMKGKKKSNLAEMIKNIGG